MTELRAGSSATELRESMMAVTRQMRRHRPDHGLTLSQMELLGEVSRTGVTTPAELGASAARARAVPHRQHQRAGEPRPGLAPPRRDDRRRQLIEVTAAGTALLDDDRAERDAWLNATMRDNLSDLEFDLLMLVAPVLRKLAYAEAQSGHTDRMTSIAACAAAQEWIAHDPDPATAAELQACSDEELAERFARPLTFGTAGLRGPAARRPERDEPRRRPAHHAGPSPRCSRTVASTGRESWSAATPGTARRSSPSRQPKSLPPKGFTVTLMFAAVPTPVVAFARPPSRRRARASRSPRRTTRRPTTATRCTSTAACRSFRPPTERSRRRSARRRTPTRSRRAPVETSGVDLIQRYVDRAAAGPAHARVGAGGAARRCTASAASTRSTRSSARDCPTCTSSRVSSRPIRTSHRAVPQSGGAGRRRRAAEAGRRQRSRGRHRAGSRRRPVRGRGADAGRLAHAHRRRNRLAAGRLHPLPDRTRSR